MFGELLAALVCGIIAGTFTGLIPGIHVNLISVLCVSSAPVLLQYVEPLTVCVAIIAMALTHTFVDAIPGIFLGAPDSSMVLNVLPGHKMLLEGKGYHAVFLTVVGSFACVLATVLCMPLTIVLVPKVYPLLRFVIGYVLIAVVVYMVYIESTFKKKIMSLIVFLLAGILGSIVLKSEAYAQPLLPMLSGLFGVSTLLLSLRNTNTIPPQRYDHVSVHSSEVYPAVGSATVCGTVTGLLPGIGSSQAALLGMQLIKAHEYTFLILVGGVNSVNFTFSLVTLYTLDKARNGALVAVQTLMHVSFSDAMLLITAILIVAGICPLLTLTIAKQFCTIIPKIPYKIVVFLIIMLITALSYGFDGVRGGLLLITSTALGILAPMLSIKRTHALGCLLLPTIAYFMSS